MPILNAAIASLPDFLVNLFTRNSAMDAPLKHLNSWSPFRLDALGLLTMLDANEISREIGSLFANSLISHISLLSGNIVPSKDPLHEYTLYNITDAIQSISLIGWFSRWLLAQHPSQNTSLFIWIKRSHLRHHGHRALAIGVLVNTCAVALTLLVGDYYGLASTLCMVAGIIVRAYLVTHGQPTHP